jgi:DNA-directed RNA polymerase specialized sigma24 family protein
LLDDLTAARPATIEALIAAFGRPMTALAYLVLHNRIQAEAVVVDVLAHAWRHGDEADATPHLRTWLLGHTATMALHAQRRSHAVDVVLPGSALASGGPGRAGRDLPAVIRAVAELPPRQRAVVAVRYLALLDRTEAAAALGMSQEALKTDERGALRRIRTFLPEAVRDPRTGVLPWAESVTDAANKRLEERLTAALARLTDLLPSGIDAEEVRTALAAPPPPRPVPWRAVGLLAALGVAVLVVVVFTILGGWAGSAGASPEAHSPAGAAVPSRPAGGLPITLASCDIAPPDTPVSFAGWATGDTLHLPAAGLPAGRPVYAVVTRGLAQMVSGRSSGGWINPPPFSRLACLFDPATGALALAGVPYTWQPPAIIDGCPASPEDSFAGYREVGGPRAWFLLPTSTTSWVVGSLSSILFRLAHNVAQGQRLTGWVQPLAGGARIEGAIDSGHPELLAPSPGASPASQANYNFLNLRFTGTGCWVMNIAVDGEVVGSAIVPIGLAAGAPTPEASPSIP